MVVPVGHCFCPAAQLECSSPPSTRPRRRNLSLWISEIEETIISNAINHSTHSLGVGIIHSNDRSAGSASFVIQDGSYADTFNPAPSPPARPPLLSPPGSFPSPHVSREVNKLMILPPFNPQTAYACEFPTGPCITTRAGQCISYPDEIYVSCKSQAATYNNRFLGTLFSPSAPLFEPNC